MRSFKQFYEKNLIKHNKGMKIYFSDYAGHTLGSKLQRANISDADFKRVLNRITTKIKKDKLKNGMYGFVFKNFKLPVEVKNKDINIKTILTKNM